MNNTTFSEKKRKKLVWQVIPILLVVFITAFAIGGGLACEKVLQLCLKEQYTGLSNIIWYLEDYITENPNYEWLLAYWEDNSQELSESIVYDSEDALNESRDAFAKANLGLSSFELKPEELETLSAESQKLYAGICLMDLTLEFNHIKAIYGLKYIYFSKLDSENNMLFLVSGLVEGEKRGNDVRDIFMLGKQVEPGFEYHPVLKEIYETHSFVDKFEKKIKKGRTGYDYNVYVPIVSGESIYVICACIDATAVQKEIYSGMVFISIFFLIILVIAISLMTFVFEHVLLKPLGLVQGQIRKYTQDKNVTDLCHELSLLKCENEIGLLSDDVTLMAQEIDRYTKEIVELTSTRQRIETELTLAHNIQKAALPSSVPDFDGNNCFELLGSSTPAKEVGGDFFDYFKIDDSHLGILIADVSGKGIPAAMFMMLSHICIKNMSNASTDLGEIFAKVNHILNERNDAEMFVTAWMGILDLDTGVITCVNAGHENPALCRNGEEYDLYKTKHSLVLAALDNVKYKTETIKLEKGDRLFLYTDGVPEATDSTNTLYGTDRMLNVLNRVKDSSCEELLAAVDEDIKSFVGSAPQFDDFTMVCLKYYGR